MVSPRAMLTSYSALSFILGKSKEIVCLQDKLSEVQQNGERKMNDLAKKLEEKELLLKKAKKFISSTKGKLLKKETEVEELNNELRLTNGNNSS